MDLNIELIFITRDILLLIGFYATDSWYDYKSRSETYNKMLRT